ncbi:non-ribosomal peptide synthetase [Kitasatospora sp. LaBMicrA B282]|uniref:non-ribosomal peptide synthetase n=1 Tax=Kitasatospora sp. LaBMicrA B282 TaxID=3420949 RepID=UPI003D105D3A
MLALSRSPLLPADAVRSAHTHAWRVALPAGAAADRLATTLADAARFWWGADFPDRLPRLWSEEVPAAAASPVAQRRLHAELHRTPGDDDGPLLRAVLLRYADGGADLVLAAHRGVLDATSLRNIAEVLLGRAPHDHFRPQAAARPGQLPADPVPAGSEPGRRMEWATGDAAAGDRTGVVTVPLAGGPADPLAVLAVAVGLVLGRYEGRPTPAVGALIEAPERPAHALGAFDSVRQLTVDLSGSTGTAALVAEAGRQLRGAAAHDEDDRPPAGIIARLPLPADESDRCGTHLPFQRAPFPLTVVPVHGPDGALAVELHHRLREVDEESARRFAGHLARAYRQLGAADPAAVPADVELLDAAERAQVLALGRPAEVPHPKPDRIEAVFAARVRERPDAVALTHGDEVLTYTELDRRAERIAAGLRAHGLRPGDRVGICLERSPDLVVTMLAVLKADGTYVPMDPAYPTDRLAHTADDAGLRLVVTTRADFPTTAPARTVRPGDLASSGDPASNGDPASAGGPGVHPPAALRGPGAAAYVIYTSGSTGRPKGVAVPHRNVVALLAATREDFRLGPEDTWTLFHSSAFDFSVWEIWGPLLTGGRLVVVPYWTSRSPEEFRELLATERVTVLNQTPAAFAQLLAAERRCADRLAVRLVVFGGEPLDPRGLADWLDRYPESRCRLVNMFGITETTVHVTAQTVRRREVMTGSRSVGRPLPGWYLYVLDERGRPVPCGAPGEIHVGGEGVALGYLNRPGLTAERFVPDPFTGGRMYRSGDRGRLRPDGRLEHLGRLDSQVKVRGFRIELDEIRHVLLDDPAVGSAAVVLGGAAGGDAAEVRLDAYVVLVDGDPAAVRRRAAKVLPDHMLPTTVTALAALPLTANGKLDRTRLPAPSPTLAGTTESSVGAPPAAEPDRAPTADPAAILIEVWQSVLGVPVGPDDNFFELGGNSLYAVKVAAALRERGLASVPQRDLYLNPTANRLARTWSPVRGG